MTEVDGDGLTEGLVPAELVEVEEGGVVELGTGEADGAMDVAGLAVKVD